MRGRGDDGVTLVELLVCIVLMGVLASALTMSFFASTRSIDQSSLRMANTHDSQMAASSFSTDMQSAKWVWTDVAPSGFETCGSGDSDSIVTFAWPGSDSGDQLIRVATYRRIDQGGERQLVRQLCSGPLFGPTTLTSTVVIAHNLYGSDPTVACFGPGNTPLPSCDGQGVIAAELAAYARANDTDDTGFSYRLRATRRPSPSTPSFVQTAAKREGSGTEAAATFANSNSAGNLIVAYVVWDNAGAVNVTDTSHNPYSPVSTSVPWSGGASAQVFYARNVKPGTVTDPINTVKATFATGVSRFGLIYITEYSGIDKTTPLDDVSLGLIGGTASAMNSGTATTTMANDLLVGLGASDHTVTGAGAGYRSRSIFAGNIVEDRIVAVPDDYVADATQSGSGWVMQLVAFRADVGGSPP
jgi:prepilin-type N-terminal cleavage/methylation domain-containing protein